MAATTDNARLRSRALEFETPRWFPSAAVVVFALVLAAGVFLDDLRSHALLSGDTFLHLRLGDEILRTHSLPHVDTLSYTRYGQHYIAHEWGFEVLAAALVRAFGLSGLAFLTAAAFAAVTGLVVRRARACGAGLVGALVAAGFVCSLSLSSYRARPQLASFVALAVALDWLGRVRLDRIGPRALLAVFAFELVWTCFHPVSALLIAMLAIETAVAFSSDRQRAKGAAKLLAVALAGFLATPYGVDIAKGVVSFAANAHALGLLEEYQRLEPGSGPFNIFVALAAIVVDYGVYCWLRNVETARRPRLAEAIVLTLLFICGFAERRWVPLAAIAAAPWLAAALTRALELVGARPGREPHRHSRASTTAAWLALSVIGSIAWMTYGPEVTIPRAQPGLAFGEQGHPVDAAEFIAAHPAQFSGPMFNAYGVGSYLTWATPDHRVFIDGRAELYGAAGIEEAATISAGGPRALKLLGEHAVAWAITESGGPLAATLASVGWRSAYDDARTVIITKP